ncbi:MAG: HAD-IIB family hydrolase [Brevinema sp.]
MKKLLACDIDGTLLHKNVVSNADVDAIRRFREDGNLLILCTGRVPSDVQIVLDAHPELACDGAVVASGGAIYRAEGTPPVISLIEEIQIDKHVGLEILTYIHEHEPLARVHWSDGNLFMNITGRPVEIVEKPKAEMVTLEEWKARDKGMPVISAYNIDKDVSKTHQLQEYIQKHWGEHVEAFTNSYYLDISAKGVDKGTGLRRGVALFAPDAQCFGVGDGLNDIPMFKALGKENSFLISSGETSLQNLVKTSVASVAECIQHIMEK